MSTKAPQHCGSDDFVACLQRHTNAPASFAEGVANELIKAVDQSVFESIVAWPKDPRVTSLVEIALAIDTDDLDQLLFVAEDYCARVIKTN